MRMLVVAAGFALALALPSGALAQDDYTAPEGFEPAEIEMGEVTHDSQATYFAAPATCVRPSSGLGACNVSLTVSWQRTPKGKWSPSGARTVVEERALSIPAGQTQQIELTVAPAKLRNVLSADDGAAIVQFELAEAGFPVAGQGVYVYPASRKGGCGGPAYMKLESGTVDEQAGSKDGHDTWVALRSPDIARGTAYRVTSRTARVRYSGITVRARKGTQFIIGCGGLSDYNNRRFFPLVHLIKGEVRLTGRPRGKGAFAAAVSTLEGNLGLRRRERADLTVTRNARRWVSTMHVRKGRSGQITPTFHGAESSPCTNGSKLSVNIKGRIREVR